MGRAGASQTDLLLGTSNASSARVEDLKNKLLISGALENFIRASADGSKEKIDQAALEISQQALAFADDQDPADNLSGLVIHGDANAIGELLRERAFPGEGFGCYRNFEVAEDAIQWSPAERQEFFEQVGEISPDDEDDEFNEREFIIKASSGYSFALGNLQIEMAWYWDGDGVLFYRIWRDGKLLRTIVNSDCKKSYRWESDTEGNDLDRFPRKAAAPILG